MEFELVSLPDEAVKQSAEDLHAQLTKPRGSLGRLEELGTWLAACQGVCPPRPLGRPRVVVFAGDHGVAAKGVSAYPPEVTAQMVANFQAGGAAINVLAGIAGATVRVVDMAVAVDTNAGSHKVRQSSGAIDREDALTEDEVEAALAAGKAIADEEIDEGADLLVAGDMGIGNTTPAAVLIAAITGSEPVAVVGRGTGIDDQTWMRKTAAIRDALRRAKPVTADPVALLRTTAGADITAMAAFLAQAAVRKTPVVLDGVVSGAAALLAEELAPGARAWWVAGHRSTEPAHTLVLEQLDLKPLLEMNMRLGEGSGATAAIPLLTMAVQVMNDMATFEDAGVSGPAEDDEATDGTPAEPATAETPATEPAAEAPAAEPAAEPSATESAEAPAEPPAAAPAIKTPTKAPAEPPDSPSAREESIGTE
jgi:nicotinate-nucleotide--dimethylbenzimidazole phosphoribosyltransferase